MRDILDIMDIQAEIELKNQREQDVQDMINKTK